MHEFSIMNNVSTQCKIFVPIVICTNNQRTMYISLKNRPRCYGKSPTVQDAFWPIPGLVSCGGVTGRLLPHAQNAVRWVIDRSFSKASSLCAAVLCATVFCLKIIVIIIACICSPTSFIVIAFPILTDMTYKTKVCV